MFRCRFCGKEYKDRRSIHGHLMTSHREEYYQNGCDDSAMIEEVTELVPGERPVGFRFLNRANLDEKLAYIDGYRFIDAEENIYSLEFAKEMGWI